MSILLFLDIDGVCHPSSGGGHFKKSCMDALLSAIQGFDISIVLTSSWRLEKSLEELKKLMGPVGRYIIDVTPDLFDELDPFDHYPVIMKFWPIYRTTKWKKYFG